MADSLQTFLFENTDIRGAIVTLEHSFAEMIAQQEYDVGRQKLIGQFCAANVLLTSHLKFDGMLNLQARAAGDVQLIMSECDSELNYRGIVDGEGELPTTALNEVLKGGTIAITIDPAKGQRYQGIVPLEADNLAACLQSYFDRSEQLPTWFRFAVVDGCAAGIMLQAMPAQVSTDASQREEDWRRITHLASTLTSEEMTSLTHEALLYRLYHEEQVRLFDERSVKFQCSCSRERMERALLGLGAEELNAIIEEQGQIETRCQFCHQPYQFNKSEVMHLIQGGEASH